MRKKKQKYQKYHALLLQETREFDGKTYFFLRKSLKYTQNGAERKAKRIRKEGDFARVIKGLYNGRISYRVYFRYSDLKRNKKKSSKKT